MYDVPPTRYGHREAINMVGVFKEVQIRVQQILAKMCMRRVKYTINY
jgi:hypothetical protein